jgi:cell wall-associated NlpC family hydrolase
MSWAIEYIGKEWVSGDAGPDSFDCWGLVRHVQKNIYNRDVPEISVDAMNIRAVVAAFNNHPERQNWEEVKEPKDGDCLLMSSGKEPTHVGIWIDIDGGGVLHAIQGTGVVFSKNANLKLLGYNTLGIYRCSQQ